MTPSRASIFIVLQFQNREFYLYGFKAYAGNFQVNFLDLCEHMDDVIAL